MSASEQLRQIYAKFYDQREVLADAPVLSQDPVSAGFDTPKADKELAEVISYLMGVPDIQKESFERIVEIIQDHYADQPEWKGLLIEYFEYVIQRDKEQLESEEDALIQEVEDFSEKLLKE